jgi:hypothetical protein
MKSKLVTALALAAALPALAQDNPWAGMKGKIKEGMWEYKMEMGAMPGMPKGMTMPPMTFSRCLTSKDIESGAATSKDGKMPEGCAVTNMKVSGNSATYTMECSKEPKMKADVAMQFQGDSFTMKQDIVMDHGGQKMPMTHNMQGRYTGPCK